MNITDKIGLIFRGSLIALFIAFLAIFYQYSQNGRYTYHVYEHPPLDCVVFDTHTGIRYAMSPSVKEDEAPYFYNVDFVKWKVERSPHIPLLPKK